MTSAAKISCMKRGGSMKVTVMFRNNWFGGDGWIFHPVTVNIGNFCPVCGARRGEPYLYRFKDCGEWFSVHKWDNPCGHIDTYKDCIVESGYKLQ